MATIASSRGRAWLARTGLLVVLVVAASAVMIGLGIWQLQRLQERRAANAEIRTRMAAAPVELSSQTANLPEYQPVRAIGSYDFSQEIVLRDQAREQSPGVHLLTPLKLDGGDAAVLVDRGWIPYTQAAASARAIYDTPNAPVTVAGLARASQTRAFFLLPADPTASPAAPRLDAWFWLNIPQIQGQIPYRLLPFFIEAAPSVNLSVLPVSSYDDIDLSDGPHLSYAIQWFSFAATLIVGSLVLWRQSQRRRAEAGTLGK